MRKAFWTVAALAAALSGPLASAEELTLTPAPEASASRPARGTSMEKVEATFGAPTNRVPPVGQPPITRWEYPGFVVFFEHNLAIHAVAKG